MPLLPTCADIISHVYFPPTVQFVETVHLFIPGMEKCECSEKTSGGKNYHPTHSFCLCLSAAPHETTLMSKYRANFSQSIPAVPPSRPLPSTYTYTKQLCHNNLYIGMNPAQLLTNSSSFLRTVHKSLLRCEYSDE